VINLPDLTLVAGLDVVFDVTLHSRPEVRLQYPLTCFELAVVSG